MLYELRPDLFPAPWLTDLELALWARYLQDRAEHDSQAMRRR